MGKNSVVCLVEGYFPKENRCRVGVSGYTLAHFGKVVDAAEGIVIHSGTFDMDGLKFFAILLVEKSNGDEVSKFK